MIVAKDKEKGWYDDNKNLDYKDSWLQNTVELAALGAIVGGAGHLAIKGDFSGVAKPGKKVFDVMVKGWENYLKRNGSQAAKFGYQVGKKSFFNLKKHPRVTGDEGRNLLMAQIDDKTKNIDQTQLRNNIATQLQKEGNLPPFTKNRDIRTWNDVVDDILDNKDSIKDNKLKNRVKVLYQQSFGTQLKRDLNLIPPEPTKQKGRLFGKNNDNSPLIDRKQLSREMISSGVAGIAFGAGISGFHALDRISSEKDNQKKLEDAFQFGGSFLSKKEDDTMNKSAGALEFHKGLKAIGKKTPEAVASGIGFTGVSLGAAKLMNDKKKKEEEENGEPKGTRVIIELGDTTPELNDKNHATAGGLSLLPKFASEQDGGLAKLAFNGTFVKDLFGHGDEIQKLKAMNYDDAAASQLKDSDVSSLLQRQYGNLVNDQTKAQFTNRLFDSRANAIKQNADNRINDLETRTAKAQLTAGGAALGIGGGLAGLAYHNREDKNV